MKPSYPRNERRGYDSDIDSNELIYDATMQDVLLPGSDTDSCICNIRDVEGVESKVDHIIKDPYILNCLFPGEIVQVKFDPQSGNMIPNGSTGLLRKAVPMSDIDVNEEGSAQLVTRGFDNEEKDVAEITVFCDEFAVKKDVAIYVQFRRDLGATEGDSQDGITPSTPGKWVPVKGTAGELNIVRGYTLSPVTTDDAEFQIEATESHPGDVTGEHTVVNPEDSRNSAKYGYDLRQGDYVTCTSWTEGRLLCIDGPCNSNNESGENPPTDILLSNNEVDEEAPGKTIGTLTAVDEDLPDDNHTFEIIGDAQGLEISGTTLKVQDSAGLDSANSPLIIEIMTTDASGNKFQKQFSITINAVTSAGRFNHDNVEATLGGQVFTLDHSDYGLDSIPQNITWDIRQYPFSPDDTLELTIQNSGAGSLAVNNIQVSYDSNLITNVSKTTMNIVASGTDSVVLTLFNGFTPSVGQEYSCTVTFLHNGDEYGMPNPYIFKFIVECGSETPTPLPP